MSWSGRLAIHILQGASVVRTSMMRGAMESLGSGTDLVGHGAVRWVLQGLGCRARPGVEVLVDVDDSGERRGGAGRSRAAPACASVVDLLPKAEACVPDPPSAPSSPSPHSRFLGLSTMLACGGAGQVYPNTTNPMVSTGDGIAMAYRAGATISNMEFVQFHPTALYSPKPAADGRTFLITEAVRGEGGRLYNARGERFMGRYDERLELAPRDIVARAIQDQMRQGGDAHVLLDISHKPRDAVLSHFPNIARKCAELGIDIAADPIPVLPAQHYTCGGVATGLLGETSLPGLYACGEVACSGLHGANRLASNSLLEGLVFANRAVNPSDAHAEYAYRHCGRQLHYAAASASFTGAQGAHRLSPALSAWVAERRAELKDTMWAAAGIVRRAEELRSAARFVASLQLEARSVLAGAGVSTEAQELVNLATVAELIIACALQRRESRGGHYILDYPDPVEAQRKPSMVSLGGAVAPMRPRSTPPLGAPAPGVVPMPMPVGAGSSKRGSSSGTRTAGPAGAGTGGTGPKQGMPLSTKKKSSSRELAVRSLPVDKEEA